MWWWCNPAVILALIIYWIITDVEGMFSVMYSVNGEYRWLQFLEMERLACLYSISSFPFHLVHVRTPQSTHHPILHFASGGTAAGAGVAFEAGSGMTARRVPGTRAGLNERSQSA